MKISSLSKFNLKIGAGHDLFKHVSLTFVTTLAIQTVTFLILAVAGLIMPVDSFAQLTVIVAAVMFSSALFELGISISATKLYGDSKESGYFRAAFAVRLLCVPVGLLIGGLVGYFGYVDIGLSIALSVVLNIWSGIRSSDQANQDYKSFGRSSITFALIRAITGTLFLVGTKNPMLIAIGIYGIPVVAILHSNSLRFVKDAFRISGKYASTLLKYAVPVYLNAIAFVAISYVPLFFIDSRLDNVAVGSFGLVLSFSGPVSLVTYALYTVLLPKILHENSVLEEHLWGAKGMLSLFLVWVVLMIGGLLLCVIMKFAYIDKFPEVVTVFMIYYSGVSLSLVFGMYSLSVHTQGVPFLNTIVSWVRLASLFGLLYLFGDSLIKTVSITMCVLIAGQLLLVYLLWRRRVLGKRNHEFHRVS